jgi:hypothetical protein
VVIGSGFGEHRRISGLRLEAAQQHATRAVRLTVLAWGPDHLMRRAPPASFCV